MSTWTHVNSAIRFDGITGLSPEPDLGYAVSFEDDEAAWDKCNIPCGSEGSLVIATWQNPNASCMARLTATIFGDLRDYDDDVEIIEYFNRITKGHMVRDAFFTCSNGNPADVRHYAFDGNLGEFKRLKGS